jgi:hypothetical protein
MIELKEWIEDGITIRKTNDGYQVFTIPTQHFDVKELNELTPDKFREMVLKQEQFQKLQNELLSASFGGKVEGELFKDLFND